MEHNDLNIFMSYDNKTSIVLFVNALDTFYVNRFKISDFDQIDFVDTPRYINYFNPIELINYYSPKNVQIKYKNLLLKGLYTLFPKIVNNFDLINKNEFSISFENNRYLSTKDKETPYYFRKEYVENPNYYYIKLSFKKMYDILNNQFYYDVFISYKLNVTCERKTLLISDIILCKINLQDTDYMNSIKNEILTSLEKLF